MCSRAASPSCEAAASPPTRPRRASARPPTRSHRCGGPRRAPSPSASPGSPPAPAHEPPVTLDPEDIERLYRAHGHLVLRRARALLANDADAQEALQEVFASLLDAPGGI